MEEVSITSKQRSSFNQGQTILLMPNYKQHLSIMCPKKKIWVCKV